MKKMIQPCGLHCIKVRNLGVSFGNQVVLRDINLHIHCGTLTALVGRNGAGKSTLVKTILGEIPHTGSIDFRDSENGHIQKLNVGYVPQTLNIEKYTPISVYDMMAAFRSCSPVFLRKKKKLYAEIQEALQYFQVEDLIDQQVCNLSGGQLQRVLLSMAVMDEPNLLLLDEPVSGIDQNGMDLFYETMDYLRKNFDLAILLVSHDLDYVARYADKVVLLDETVLKQGSVREVYQSEEFQSVFKDAAFPWKEEVSK
ncbi:MAG: metal ABC transporter ATP-binding protein [Lachnospiraceae bacterium]